MDTRPPLLESRKARSAEQPFKLLVSLGYLAVVLNREDERDVDVDALGEGLLHVLLPKTCRCFEEILYPDDLGCICDYVALNRDTAETTKVYIPYR